MKGCFRVDSGTSNLRVGYSCLRPKAVIDAYSVRMAATGPGCVKTRKRPREIDFKLLGFSVEARGLLGFRYVTSSPLTPFHWLFEYDFSR